MRATVFILLCSFVCKHVNGYQNFQQKIPNGEMVPHPCKLNFLWRGVGHDNIDGGGARNAFGSDFANNGLEWNATICLMDSDGDGKTNGKELGDPDCVWKPNEKPSFETGLSHPGVCEPIDGEQCQGKTDFVNCEQAEFTCPNLDTEDTAGISTLTARLQPRTYTKNRKTAYVCQEFMFPTTEQQIVAYKPYVDNRYIVHHMTVFGCTGEFPGRKQPRICGMVPSRNCIDIIAVWSLGMPGHCMHKDCGILVGGNKGYRWASLQVHWNNPELLQFQFESSGIIFYLSSKLRPFNAGILSIGQTELAIPPGEEEYTEWGTCDSQCTKLIIQDQITVVSVYNHMHYLGKAQTTDLITRTDTEEHIQHLADDQLYNYDDPVLHEFKDGVTVKSGDELRTTCVYKSTSRYNTTYFGDDTSDEMCFSFLTYFPAENSETSCLSVGKGSQCKKEDDEVCDPSRLSMHNPELLTKFNDIQMKCTPGFCRDECLNFVKDQQKDPCFGDITGTLRESLIRVDDFDNPINLIFAALDSCNKELMMEQVRGQVCNTTGDEWLDFNLASQIKGHNVYLGLSLLCLFLNF